MVLGCKDSKYLYNDKIISHFCVKFIVIRGVVVKNVKKFGLQIIFSYFCSRIRDKKGGQRYEYNDLQRLYWLSCL